VTPNKNPQAERISLRIYLLPKLLPWFGQVFWLVDLPTDRAFPCRFVLSGLRHSGFLRGSSSLTAAGPRRSYTDFPFQTCTDYRLSTKYHRCPWLLSSNHVGYDEAWSGSAKRGEMIFAGVAHQRSRTIRLDSDSIFRKIFLFKEGYAVNVMVA